MPSLLLLGKHLFLYSYLYRYIFVEGYFTPPFDVNPKTNAESRMLLVQIVCVYTHWSGYWSQYSPCQCPCSNQWSPSCELVARHQITVSCLTIFPGSPRPRHIVWAGDHGPLVTSPGTFPSWPGSKTKTDRLDLTPTRNLVSPYFYHFIAFYQAKNSV